MKKKYRTYWRKTGLKGKWGDIFLSSILKYRPKNFLEIGVFCGVTAKNVCSTLHKIHGNNFSYTGVDLFGGTKITKEDEVEPNFLKTQKFSNPLKNIYYNYLLRENLNSLESVTKFLKRYENNTNLIKGDTNDVLKKIDLEQLDYVFIDGGHSYNTVLNDLNLLYEKLKGKSKILFCDDYGKDSQIDEVKKAIDDFVKSNKVKMNIVENRFAEIIT